ncbi:GDP-mannose 4,6-dehydratase [Gallibacterium salpingitidis]|uniref:Epimerase n=1 Tax=Gallibacterium salpingitidis TaxID=505341 RepID=A0A1A7P239_9PAST|nr:GDP-mannose 4,6-dehydratase [Gallibacterium salpingitidis]OBW95294.1 epimerase [Gallibacterium salpingitidis]
MIKVLITGIDSFTGAYLKTCLTMAKYDVYGTSVKNISDKVSICDIKDKQQIKSVLEKVKPEFIIHLSGISFAAHDKNDDFYAINTVGTTNLLESVIELNLNIQKIILASSATVYGNQGLEVLDESLHPKPSNHYGMSKYAMECLARNYFDKLPIIIARPFNYTGIGQADHFLIPKIVKHYREKKSTIELGNLDVAREFNSVEDVCDIYKRLLESDIHSEIVNICSGKGIKLLDVIDIMNEIAGYKMNIKVNPLFVRKGEIKTLTGSKVKLEKLLGNIKFRKMRDILSEIFIQ